MHYIASPGRGYGLDRVEKILKLNVRTIDAPGQGALLKGGHLRGPQTHQSVLLHRVVLYTTDQPTNQANG